MNIPRILSQDERQSKIGDADGHIILQKHVATFDVAMRDQRFLLRSVRGRNNAVQESEATRHRLDDREQIVQRDRVAFEIVVQRSALVVVGDQPQLLQFVRVGFGRYEQQDVRLVDNVRQIIEILAPSATTYSRDTEIP